jgi:nucleotidyltransferase/DNA polymerase involved in DNA repair
MVVCVHIPRFELITAAGGSEALASAPLALAPAAGGELCIGEVSGAAEAQGVAAGMALGEALARCPGLRLVPADPLAVADAWEAVLAAIEGIGAEVESDRPGLAHFQAEGLRGIHGSERGAISAARRRLGRPSRIGAGPTRFCATAAAFGTSARRARIIDAAQLGDFLSAQPVSLLGLRVQTQELVEPLARLGVRTLGELAALGRDALCDRFGEQGGIAHRLACGEDSQLQPRSLEEQLEESLEVGDASSGEMLGRVLGVLVDRLLSRPERRGRTLRVLRLSARLVGEGTWHERVVLRQALSDAERICLALSLRLPLLPAPVQALGLRVERFGPPAGEQRTLLEEDGVARRERLGEAVSQVRAVAGPEGALRAVCVDPDSRVPERRVVLTPISR